MMVSRAFVFTWQGGAQADGEAKPDTEMHIWGPFLSDRRAATWGSKWQKDNGDDPRWQTIRLPKNVTTLHLEVQRP